MALSPFQQMVEGIVRRPPLAFAAARDFIEHFEDLDLDAREAEQARLIGAVLKSAGNASRYAHLRLASLADAPVMDKNDVRANSSSFKGRTVLPVSRAVTSGSTGTPLKVARSFGALVFEQAAIDWVVAKAGHDFRREKIVVLRGADFLPVEVQEPPFWRPSQDGRQLNLSANHLAPETLHLYVDAIRAFGATILYAYPSSADYFARMLKESGLELHFPLVVTSSETCPPDVRSRLQEVFGAKSLDYYGQSERVSFAYSLAPGVYHFLGSYGAVELPRSGDEDHVRGVIGTSLHNRAQMLLRYRTGDRIELLDGAFDLRAICLGAAPFKSVVGREYDCLIASGGRVYFDVSVVPHTLEQYGRLQFVQTRPDHVVIQIAGAAPEVLGRTEPVLERARLKLPPEFEVEVVFVEELTRAPSGKTPFVLNAIAGSAAA